MTSRWRRILSIAPLLAALVAAPFVWRAVNDLGSNTTDMRQWLPDGDDAREEYDWFLSHFGADDFLLVSWPDCTMGDVRLEELAFALSDEAGPNAPAERQLFRQIATGDEWLERLMAPPTRLSREAARARLQGLVLGPENRTCLVLEFTPRGKLRPRRIIDLVRQTALRAVDIDRDNLILGGPVYEVVAIDDASQSTMRDCLAPSMAVALVIALICLRNFRQVLAIMATSGYAAGLSMMIVHQTSGSMNAVMVVMPTLIYVLTFSGAVHLVNYFRDADRQGAPDAAAKALSVGWSPCALASLSTALGLLSLCVSQIEPVRAFGGYSAAGLMLSLAALLGLLPAALRWRRPREEPAKESRPPALHRCAQCITSTPNRVTVVGLLLLAIAFAGLFRTTTTVKVEQMFRPDSELLTNYRWLEEQVAPLSSVEIVVGFRRDGSLTMVDRLQLLRDLDARLRDLDFVRATHSAATFVPKPRRGGSAAQVAQRRLLERRLQRGKGDLAAEKWLAEEGDVQWWRLSVRMPVLADVDFARSISAVQRQAEAIVENAEADVELRFTGAYPLLHQAQHQLLDDLVRSFAMAFVLICPLMMLVLRSAPAGLLAMAPNIAPAVVVFGGMGWWGAPIDIGSVLTASVALGIGVDDTLHFLTWFRRGLAAGEERAEAICQAWRRCAPAMFQTTIICGLSLLVFTQSAFVPASRFAVLMFLMLAAALIGDLVLLPAMLAGRLGGVFERRR